MKVLVSDNLGEIGVEMFKKAEGIDVDVKTGLSPDELKKIINEYDGLVIRSATKVTEDILDAGTRLRVVGRAGIGLDNVDIPAATKRGIIVMNTPGGNVVTTAEHAIAMMLSLTRNIPAGTATLKAGIWEKKKLQGREIFNKVLGLIGFGKIGSIVADRARGLKMRVIIHDPFVQSDIIEKAGYESVTLEELYKKADYITVHVPKLKDTAGLLDKNAFDQMKDGVMVINCARGGIINEDDLYDAMKSGKVAGAALDVFATEPPGKIKLLELDNLVCTPHLGASTLEAQTNVAVQVAGQIIDYLQNGTILNAVNTPSVTGELLVKLGPYLSLANQMGLLLAQLGKGALKEVEIEFNGDFQGLDMSPVTSALIKGLLSPILKDDVNFINALIIAGERGIKISESTNPESKEYMNLVSVKAVTDMGTNSVAGTIFGKRDSRVVRINTFRLEMVLKGHLALIYNIDKPGSIGQIGTVLGKHNVNIARMQVGQEEKGDRNIIFLCTDSAIPDNVLEELRGLSLVKSVTPFQF
ncbi:MAG: phosphoglycerate dehydrogenase [Proteobacteria bacterium]|nr:phosphoglycerate dehydrogenase [Pseudomonadota bacterium]MBU4470921.1 phosphoglycerate dehydrogenase [Pseudomonadota bacterium]MCG2751919.1 phosphoglycerate dehydrogenase [Desulfobacteraceae bacterium]